MAVGLIQLVVEVALPVGIEERAVEPVGQLDRPKLSPAFGDGIRGEAVEGVLIVGRRIGMPSSLKYLQ